MDTERELAMEYYDPWTSELLANSELLPDAQEYDLQDNYGQELEIMVSQNCRRAHGLGAEGSSNGGRD